MKEYGSPPWKYTNEGYGSFYIRDAAGRQLIWMGGSSLHAPGQNEAITKAICKAMNGRNELLEALEYIRSNGGFRDLRHMNQVDALIVKAKGETQ